MTLISAMARRFRFGFLACFIKLTVHYTVINVKAQIAPKGRNTTDGGTPPVLCTQHPEALEGRKMVVFRAFSTHLVCAQCKRGLSSPPVFSPAFQAYVGQSVFSPFFIFLLCSSSRNQGGNLVWKLGLVPSKTWLRLISSSDFLPDFLPQAIKLGQSEFFV